MLQECQFSLLLDLDPQRPGEVGCCQIVAGIFLHSHNAAVVDTMSWVPVGQIEQGGEVVWHDAVVIIQDGEERRLYLSQRGPERGAPHARICAGQVVDAQVPRAFCSR